MSEERKKSAGETAPEKETPKAVALADAEKRLTDVFEEKLTAFQAQIDTQLKEIEDKGKASETLGDEMSEAKASLEALRLEVEKMRTNADRTAAESAVSSLPGYKSFGARLEEVKDEFEERLSETRARGIPFKFTLKLNKESLFPTTQEREEKARQGMEYKTTITSAAVGSSTPGILTPDRVVDYVPAAERRLTIRDLLPSRPTESNTVEFVSENAFTNAASPQVEASAKAESALTFSINSENVRTLAHWIPATAQVLDDWVSLRRIIDDKMIYGLKLDEEDELLNGSDTGQHLNGLVTQATAYAGTYDVAADTRLDRLGWACLEAEDDDEEVDFMVVHPQTWWTILHIKDAASNVGNYVVGDPFTGGLLRDTRLWGKRVVVTNSMTAVNFLVGNSRQAEIFDRQEANIMISTEHNDYFTQNMVAIRAEERLALVVYRAGAFIYGSFA